MPLWQNGAGKIRANRPEKPVIPWQIALSFLICPKIGQAGFALDDPDLSFWAKRQHIDP